MAAVAIGVGTAVTGVWSAISGNRAAKKAEEVGRENAATLLETAERNVALQLEAAQYNAGSILRVGEANAQAIEYVYNQNAALMSVEAAESIRRHFLEEQQTLGTIRAMQGSSGAQVNTDTNLHYLLDQAWEAEYSRNYQATRLKTSILNYMDEQQIRADLTRLDASERADVLLYNAMIESQVTMNEANAQALALERGGQLQGSIGRMQAIGNLISGISGAYEAYVKYS